MPRGFCVHYRWQGTLQFENSYVEGKENLTQEIVTILSTMHPVTTLFSNFMICN